MNTSFPHRLIYQAGKSGKHTDIRIHATRLQRIIYSFLQGTGFGAFIFAGLLLFFSFGPVLLEEAQFAVGRFIQKREVKEANLVNLPVAERTIAVQAEAKSYGVDPHFSVVIPKIDAKANVVANVNAASRAEYEAALQSGIAHAAGTYFPGQGKNIYLFSHSTDFDFNVARYNAVFYLLRKLEPGDRIIVYFSDEKFVYVVEEMMVVPATETGWLTGETDSEILYLQTCDPPGTTWNRLIVKTKPIV